MKSNPYNQTIDAGSGGPDEQAARWSECLRESAGGAAERATFEAWLADSAAHPRAFKRVDAAQAWVGALADAPPLRVLRDETLARVRRRACRRHWGFALAASLLLVAGSGWLLTRPFLTDPWQGLPALLAADARYRTDVGQRSVVRLDDGSLITLNTDSRVRVRYSPARREVALERGQALFQVAKDATRPFVVSADDRQVTALGTRFDVLLSSRELEVTLIEGRVVVTGGGAAMAVRPARPARTELRPGQQLVVSEWSPQQVRHADVERVASWVLGRLVFRDERLVDAVTQMNRYSRRKILLGDRQLASLRLSGAFDSGDVDAFVAALIDYFPIERHARDDVVILRMRATPTAHGSRPRLQ